MVELLARSAAAGLVPLEIGRVKLTELDAAPVYMVSGGPDGQAALERQFGPIEARQVTQKAGQVVLPFAPGQALLRGEGDPPGDAGLHVTEQSDAWVWLALEGADSSAVLARLVAVDLEISAFGQGQICHVLIGHMNGLLWRVAPDRFVVVAFRSMAHTLVQELTHAMQAVAARRSLPEPLL